MTVNFSHYKGINRKLTDPKKTIIAKHALTMLFNDAAAKAVSEAVKNLSQAHRLAAEIFAPDLPTLEKYGLCRTIMGAKVFLGIYEPGVSSPKTKWDVLEKQRSLSSIGEWVGSSFSDYLDIFEKDRHDYTSRPIRFEKCFYGPNTVEGMNFRHGPRFCVIKNRTQRCGPTDAELADKPWLGWHIEDLPDLDVPEDLQKKIHEFVCAYHDWATELRLIRLEVMRFIDRTDKFEDILKQWPAAAELVEKLFPLTEEAMAERDPLKTARKFMKSTTPEAA